MATRGVRPCRSGSSSEGSRWSAAGPTCWRGGVAGTRPEPAETAPAPPTLPDPAPGETTDDLAYHASNALIELDDAVQTSEHELGLAQTQFGDEAVTDFRAALEQSRTELVQAFALRQRIDDEKPDEPTRRGLLSQILHLCATADQRLDAQSAAFDRLRDLEQNLPQVLAGLKPKLNATAGRVPGTTAALDALRGRYAGSALEPVADNIPQATARLDVARTEIEEAGTELAADKRAAAAVSARAAEEAIEQAGTLLDGVRRLADELAQAANRLVEARAEIEADLAEARLLPGAELAAAVARAEAALTSAGREVRARTVPAAATRWPRCAAWTRPGPPWTRRWRTPRRPGRPASAPQPSSTGRCSRPGPGSRRRRTSSRRGAAPSAATPAPGWRRLSGTSTRPSVWPARHRWTRCARRSRPTRWRRRRCGWPATTCSAGRRRAVAAGRAGSTSAASCSAGSCWAAAAAAFGGGGFGGAPAAGTAAAAVAGASPPAASAARAPAAAAAVAAASEAASDAGGRDRAHPTSQLGGAAPGDR